MIFRNKIQVLAIVAGSLATQSFSPVPAFAQAETKQGAETDSEAEKATQALRTVESKYSKASSVEMAIVKKTENKLLKKKKSSSGTLTLKGAGHFRMEFSEPDKSTIILNGKKLWIVQLPQDPDFDNTTRVTVSKDLKKMQSPVLSTFLMGKGSLLDDFKITKQTLKDHLYDIEMTPKKPHADVKSLTVQFDYEKNEITQLTMKDNVDNSTEFDFEKIKFNGKVSDKIFEYKAPKDAEINEL